MVGGWPPHVQQHLLALHGKAVEEPMRLRCDLRVKRPALLAAVHVQQDRPHWVCVRQLGQHPVDGVRTLLLANRDDEIEHAVARVWLVFCRRGGLAQLRSQPDKLIDDCLQVCVSRLPVARADAVRLEERDGAYGLCHDRPSCVISRSAPGGPHVPAEYVSRGGWPWRQTASMPSISFHAASTSSERVKSVGSPSMQSRSSRSYASGASTRNADAYRKSMLTLRIVRVGVGTLAPNRSEIPSSG